MEMLVVIGGIGLALASAIIVVALRGRQHRAQDKEHVSAERRAHREDEACRHAEEPDLATTSETPRHGDETKSQPAIQAMRRGAAEAHLTATRQGEEEEHLAVEREAQHQREEARQKAEEDARLTSAREMQREIEEAHRLTEEEARLATEQKSQHQAEEARQKSEEDARLASARETQREIEEGRRLSEEERRLATEQKSQHQREQTRQKGEEDERLASAHEAQSETEAHGRTDEEVCRATEPEEQRQADEENRSVSEEVWPDKPDDGDREADTAPVIERTPKLPTSSAKTRPRQPAVHRDRRGNRRASPAGTASSEAASTGPALATRAAAEAKLRLALHPIRRTARISVVLTRPEGFPERVMLQAGVQHAIEAYDTQRYDDLDLPWTGELLDGELRLANTDGFRWVRSARRVHIFATDPNEPDLISVGAARRDVAHTLVCRSGDAADVRAAAASVGSPDLQAHEHWQGIPEGWMVLSGYTPAHTAEPPLPNDLRPLDPGAGLKIVLEEGLAIRPQVYAEGHPPRILISPARSASITIGGKPATLSASGAWEAPGWDAPGQHIVDVVPGPSASYEIAADPWAIAGWDFWNAHSGRFQNQPPRPWTRAEICGAQIRGPTGETVFAAETQPTLIALGLKSGAVPLQRRGDVSVSVGFMAEAPAFLLAATGQRRTQGRVIWLGLAPASRGSRRLDTDWFIAVRSAASRRLPLQCSDAVGEDAWRKAKERARRLKRPRS